MYEALVVHQAEVTREVTCCFSQGAKGGHDTDFQSFFRETGAPCYQRSVFLVSYFLAERCVIFFPQEMEIQS